MDTIVGHDYYYKIKERASGRTLSVRGVRLIRGSFAKWAEARRETHAKDGHVIEHASEQEYREANWRPRA